jgi:hypothetical protein
MSLFLSLSLFLSFSLFIPSLSFFDDKVLLFHDLEFAHITVFYLGLGLIVQGLVLAIVNSKFFCGATLPLM